MGQVLGNGPQDLVGVLVLPQVVPVDAEPGDVKVPQLGKLANVVGDGILGEFWNITGYIYMRV